MSHSHNRPNDLAIDRQGRIWFTDPFGRGRPVSERELNYASVLRLDPQPDGDWALPVPVDRPTNCTFGDADLGTLYVTTGGGHLFRVRHTGRRGWLLHPP